MLRDSNNNFSARVLLSQFVDRRPAVGAYFPGIVPISNNMVLGHAVLSSARIPLARFQKSGFNMGSVKSIYISLGGATNRGGLYFGDTWAVNLPDMTTQDGDTEVTPALMTDAAGAPPPTLALVPASEAAPADQTQQATPDAPATPADADHRIVSIRRGSLQVSAAQHGVDENPEAPATRSVPSVELTLATPGPITDTSATGLSVTIGGRRVNARVFATDNPRLTRVVVPSDAIAAVPDGGSLSLASPGHVWHFGPLDKSAIR